MEQSFRQLDLGTLQPFATGGTGGCYRLSEDTILKLYYENFPVENILQEKEGAKAALIAGVPTAISFEPVQVGNRYGVLYEMVQGPTMSEAVVAEPERAGELGREFGRIALTLSRAEVRIDIPGPTVAIRKALGKITYASPETMRRILAFVETLETEKHYVHGDFQPNNVIITKNGPLLIDMGSFSVGCPLFDAATVLFSLFESPEARESGRSSFNGLSHEEAADFGRGFLAEYFGGEPDPETARKLRRVLALKKLYFECMFGQGFSEEVCRDLRREALAVFEEDC